MPNFVTLVVLLIMVCRLEASPKKKFVIFTEVRLNYSEATEFCVRIGQELAAITSSEENYELVEQFNANKPKNFNEDKAHGFFTSGNDFDSEKNFVWGSTGDQVGYTNWGEDEPMKKFSTDNCISLYSSKLLWNYARCNLKRHVICQYFV